MIEIIKQIVVSISLFYTTIFGNPSPPPTNLGYLIIESDYGIIPTIISPSGLETKAESGGILEDDENPQNTKGEKFWNIELKNPESGTYTLKFTAAQKGAYQFEVNTFDNAGKNHTITQTAKITTPSTASYKLNYSKEGKYSPNLTLSH